MLDLEITRQKVLITGGNGFIASLVRSMYKDCDVILVSRKDIGVLLKRETNIICSSLEQEHWWLPLENYKPFNHVLHFAEPVKQDSNIDQIAESHTNFLNWACKNSDCVTYPLTAYMYDTNRNLDPYVSIKRKVAKSVSQYSNIRLPIVHPVVNSGNGINRLIKLEEKIPFVNIFCAFNARIKVVESDFLAQRIVSTKEFGLFDIYSHSVSISELFSKKSRKDVVLLSRLLNFLLTYFTFSKSIKTLVCGRRIDHDKIL